MHGGINRTYSYYVPASYNAANPVPMVIGLHGLSSSGSDFAEYRDFRPIADTANFIVVHPDGSTMLGIRFWNYGNVLGSTVDDVGFLEALIDTISVQFAINSQRVYCVGMSNGSFMAYHLACESDRFAAIGGVTGSMSVNMYNNCNPGRPTPAIHIHGTEDDVNPYEGTSTMVGIEDLNRFWVDQNDCDTVPLITQVPDINTSDNSSATHYLFSGGIDGNTVELYKINGGGHSWPGSPMPSSSEVTCMDFDASIKIWEFFSQYEISEFASLDKTSKMQMKLWPNPTSGEIFLDSDNGEIARIRIFNLNGEEIEKIEEQDLQYIDLRHLQNGVYAAEISGNNFSVYKKIIISH